MDVFFNGGVFVVDVFSHAIMDEACGATNVLLTTAVAVVNINNILRLSGYPENRIEQTKRPQSSQRNPQPDNAEWSYLNIPYISE